MKKDNKNIILISVVVLLVLGLLVCVSINIYNSIRDNNNNSNDNTIKIDDNSNKKDNTDKKDNSKIDNKIDDNKKTNNDIDIDVDLNPNNTSSNNGNTFTTDYGNGVPVDTGTGIGNGTGYSGVSGTGGTTSSTTASEDPGKVIVSDSTQEWGKETNLKIFNVDKISPGDYGSYDFTIDNNTNRNAIYDITFDENNDAKANILYKLKRNGSYIAGSEEEWIKYDILNIKEKVLNSYSKDLYTIEWKWVDAVNDTIVGRTKGATYGLKIFIKSNETTLVDGSGTSVVYNPKTGDNLIYFVELLIISSILVIIVARKKNNNEMV